MDASVNLGAPDYQGILPVGPAGLKVFNSVPLVDDPVYVSTAVTSTGSGVDPQPVGAMPAAKAPVASPLGGPQLFVADPLIAFSAAPAPSPKGGGAQNQPALDQAHSAGFLLMKDALYNPTLHEQPWGEDEVMTDIPQAPGSGGPGWNTADDSALGKVSQLIDNVVSGTQQATAAVMESHGYDGTTDAYPFSYGAPGYQSARNAFASTNQSNGSGGLLVLLLILWVIFK